MPNHFSNEQMLADYKAHLKAHPPLSNVVNRWLNRHVMPSWWQLDVIDPDKVTEIPVLQGSAAPPVGRAAQVVFSGGYMLIRGAERAVPSFWNWVRSWGTAREGMNGFGRVINGRLEVILEDSNAFFCGQTGNLAIKVKDASGLAKQLADKGYTVVRTDIQSAVTEIRRAFPGFQI